MDAALFWGALPWAVALPSTTAATVLRGTSADLTATLRVAMGAAAEPVLLRHGNDRATDRWVRAAGASVVGANVRKESPDIGGALRQVDACGPADGNRRCTWCSHPAQATRARPQP